MAFVQDLLLLSLAIVCVCCAQRLTYFESDLTLSDKLCPADEIEFELNSKGVITCLSHCALSGTCEGAIHVEEKGTSTCFGVKSASPFSTSVALPGAMFYKKTTTAINAPCPDGWMFFENSCYYVDASAINFTSAQRFCTGIGSKLVEIETSDEDAFIRSYLQVTQGTEFWIGITDEEEEDVWKMADSLETVTYLNWGWDQPNNGWVANCGAIWKLYLYQWVDEACNMLFQPVCEMAI